MEITSITLSLSGPPPSLPLSSSHSTFFTSATTLSFVDRTSSTKPRERSLLVGRPRSRTRAEPPRKGLTCNALFGLGVPELVVIAGVAALVFGPKKLPEVGRSIGKTVKSFQQVFRRLRLSRVSIWNWRLVPFPNAEIEDRHKRARI